MSGKSSITHGMTGTTEYNNYRTAKRRDAKKTYDAGFSFAMRREMNVMFPNCVVCGGSEHMAIDHILPLSHGHGLSLSNAIRLCASCNGKKKDKYLYQLPKDILDKILSASGEFSDVLETQPS